MHGIFIPILLNCCEVGQESGEKLHRVPDPALKLSSRMIFNTAPYPSQASELYLVNLRVFTVMFSHLLGLTFSLAPSPQISKTPV